MTGPFIAHETLLQCQICPDTFGSDTLLEMVTSRCNVGYDILVFVGRALFQRHRTTREICAELAARDIRLSASEIEHLGRKFVTYLAMGHRMASPRIRQAMTLAGGYVLHLDATHEGDAPALMTGMDSLSEIVLANVKIPTEHAEHIAPFLEGLRQTYGNPAACVHDMGTGICKAVAKVFPGVRDFVCHFHFLRDIGKDFLDPAYIELRNCLRKHATSTRLRSLAREAREHLRQRNSDTAALVKAIKAADLSDDTELLRLDLFAGAVVLAGQAQWRRLWLPLRPSLAYVRGTVVGTGPPLAGSPRLGPGRRPAQLPISLQAGKGSSSRCR